MEKLHDRLRIFSNAAYAVDIDRFMDVVNADSSSIRDIALAISDEIERTYIPKHTDIDGNPWCEGDECTVIMSGKNGLISGYRSDQVLASFPDGDVWYYPAEIRRIERDIIERINDDAKMLPVDYCIDHGIKVNHGDRFDVHNYYEAMCRDLLKRQREVLERGK